MASINPSMPVANGRLYSDNAAAVDGVSERNLFDQIRTGGIGRVPGFADTPEAADEIMTLIEKQYLPGRPKSISGIATTSFVLGVVLSSSLIANTFLSLYTTSPLWRIPSFLCMLSIFHFLEFWTTATYNTKVAQVSSFLLSQNGSAYNFAHTAAMTECLLVNLFFPDASFVHMVSMGRLLPGSSATLACVCTGIIMVIVGQTVRSIAMVQAGASFNHVVQFRRREEHRLITNGIYSYLRHPSYFGFFWWGLGTQLVLGNRLCFAAYAVILWRFFNRRISGEEQLLVVFFKDDYINYRSKTPVGIPFIK